MSCCSFPRDCLCLLFCIISTPLRPTACFIPAQPLFCFLFLAVVFFWILHFFLDFSFFSLHFRVSSCSWFASTFVRERAGVHRYSGYRRVDCIVKLELYSAETPAGSFRSALGPAFRTFRPNLLPSAVGEPLDPSRRSRKAACTLVGGTERLLGLDLGLGL